MPAVLWVSLPREWKLEDVQAGLQVVIALLCTWGIFAFSRFCWQLSSNLVRKNRAVALASLMSITTIGEAYDVIALLKRRIFLSRYWKLLAQSIVVVSLTVATIVSGPIAKASTRYGSVIKTVDTPGLLAYRNFNSRSYANVDWNLTAASLDRAGFPLDQMLDFLPHPNTTWIYRENEWNNSWTMQCERTPKTQIALSATGVCGNFTTELPDTDRFFNYKSHTIWDGHWQGLIANGTILKNGFLVVTGWSYPGLDLTTKRTYEMKTTIAVVHAAGLTVDNTTSKCNFNRSVATSASYMKIQCTLKRPRTVPDEKHISFPDTGDWFALPQVVVTNYYNRFATQANTGENITMVTPDELIRFYQTYVITKDLQYPHLVTRKMTADLQVVQLSSTFIAFGSLYALLVLVGLVNFSFFAYRNKDVMRDTPNSKLDWIVQSIIDESEAQRRTLRSRRSVVASLREESLVQGAEKVRSAFENAKYGTTATEELPLTDHAGSQAGSIYHVSPAPGYGFTSPTPYDSYSHGNTPFYNMNPFEASYATQQRSDYDTNYELQNPGQTFISGRSHAYQRLG